MTLHDLQHHLRLQIRARMERGDLTGNGLSHQAGLQQSHLSNFLNSRRGLSLESMDRLLASLHLGVLDLADRKELQRHVRPAGPAGECENIAVVTAAAAAQAPRFSSRQVQETVSFRKSFLARFRAHDICQRDHWQRFVVIRPEARAMQAAFGLSVQGASVLIDRHYNSPRSYRRDGPGLYAVFLKRRCLVGHLALAGNRLLLRPRNPELPLEVLEIENARSYSHQVIGRICHIGLEV